MLKRQGFREGVGLRKDWTAKLIGTAIPTPLPTTTQSDIMTQVLFVPTKWPKIKPPVMPINPTEKYADRLARIFDGSMLYAHGSRYNSRAARHIPT